MIHTQETKQQVDSNTCCKPVSVSGKNAQHSNWIFKARRQKCNILDRSKEVECWESNGNILICTPQLEKLFQSTFFSHSNLLSSSPTFTSITRMIFCCFHLTTLFLTFVRPFAGGICIYVHACVCAREWLRFVCVSVGYEKIKPGGGTAGIPSDIAWPFCLAQSHSYTHTHTGHQV